MGINEKVAFIRGLVEGLQLDTTTKEGKVLAAIVDLLDDMALTVTDMDEYLDDLSEHIDAVDEDLHLLEEYCCDEECNCDCDEDDDLFYEVTCPVCDETVCLSEEMLLDGEIDCPNCGEKLEFDFSDLDDCCCCDEDEE